MQVAVAPWLPLRMIFTLAGVLSKNLTKGVDYEKLKPVYSIWVLASNLFNNPFMHHRFEMYDKQHDQCLTNNLEIHTLELPKCPSQDKIMQGLDQWVYLLEHAGEIDPSDPPAILRNPVLDEVWTMLKEISQHERQWAVYLSRQDAVREQLTIKNYTARLEQELRTSQEEHRAKDEALKASQEEHRAKDEALKASQEEHRAKDEALKASQDTLRKLAENPEAVSPEAIRQLLAMGP